MACVGVTMLLMAGVTAAAAETVTVEEAVARSLARSPAAQAAVFETSAAAARQRAARAAYTPQFSAKGEFGRSAGFDERVTNGGITSALFGVETALVDGGLRDAEFAAARARLRAATAIEQQRRAEIAFATRSAYFTALAAQAEERTRHEAIDTVRGYATLLERQVGMGLAAHDEVLRAQLAVKDAETARRAAATELTTALQELGSLIGSSFDAAALVEPTVTRPAIPTPEVVDAAPILVDARAAVETARREADAVRSEQRGQLKVSADAGALGVPFVSTFRDHGGGQFLFGQVLEGDRAIPLRLRYPETVRTDMRAIQDLTLVAPGSALAPLAALARLGPGPVAVQRTRENLRQLVRLTARLEGRDLGSATRDVRDALARDLVLPAGVSLEYGGLYASQQRAFRELVVVFFAAVACVLALLLIEFGSVSAALAIVVGSSLALSGSLAALWATGTALNVSSMVGMIMVVGIVAKNGILLLDFAGRGGSDTDDVTAALVRAGRVRLRPILMTSLAAVAGLAPLAFGIGAGGQMQRPLAIAILGGVSLAMLFSLLGVPLLYLLLTRRRAVRGEQPPTDKG